MWYYMIACYGLSLLTFFLILTAFFQSFLRFPLFHAGHVSVMVLLCILYSFTETMIIFFFVDIGTRIKELSLEKKIDPGFRQRSIAIKKKVFPPLTMNLLLMTVLCILSGAVDTRHIPPWAYVLFYLGCVIHFVKTKVVEHRAFRESSDLLVEISKTHRE